MASTVPTHYKVSFTNLIRLLQQQRPSRFRMAVLVDTAPTISGKAAAYDQLDATSMVPITDRHGKTQVTDDFHKRRWVTFLPAEKATLVDRVDLRRVSNDPRSSHARNHSFAGNRYFDDRVVESFFAASLTGEEVSTGTTAFPASNVIAAGATGLDLGKLKVVNEKLKANENEKDDGDFSWHIAVSSIQERDILGETEAISSDFNVVKTLVGGSMIGLEWMGLRWHHSERLQKTGTDRQVPVWVKSSMQAAVSQDIRTFMDVLPERRHSVQIRTEVDQGATRLDEKGVFDIRCTEA